MTPEEKGKLIIRHFESLQWNAWDLELLQELQELFKDLPRITGYVVGRDPADDKMMFEE